MRLTRRTDSPLRCAVCHEDLPPDGPEALRICLACQTVLHAECTTSRACPTLGCLGRYATARPPARMRLLGFLACLVVAFLPAVPFVLMPIPFYRYCADHLVTGFDMMGTIWPLKGLLLLLGVFIPSLLLNETRRRGVIQGWLMLLLIGLSFTATAWTFWTEPTASYGHRLWEQDVLKPRERALRALLDQNVVERQPVVVDGYTFPKVEHVAEGLLLYTVVGGGPWPGWGVFVPRDPGVPARISLSGRRVTSESSVAGLYWFMEGP